jgi:hypothetical protein
MKRDNRIEPGRGEQADYGRGTNPTIMISVYNVKKKLYAFPVQLA